MASIAPAVVFATRLRPCDAFELALGRVESSGSDQSIVWLEHLLPKLGGFLENGRSVLDIRDVETADVVAWVNATLPDGRYPSLATQHNRRSAATSGFRILRELGVADHDPTLDLALASRTRGRETRPLMDDEVEAGRASSVDTLSESRLPSVWALAEATATTHEIPRVRPEDVDLDAGTVLLSGSAKTESRTADLNEWGVRMLARRLNNIDRASSLTYEGRGSAPSMQASSSMAISRVLDRAGLRGDPAVKPESVRGWAGQRVWRQTGRIETAAIALGCRSLDTASAIVGYEWADRA